LHSEQEVKGRQAILAQTREIQQAFLPLRLADAKPADGTARPPRELAESAFSITRWVKMSTRPSVDSAPALDALFAPIPVGRAQGHARTCKDA
jgi:hypothetical protein